MMTKKITMLSSIVLLIVSLIFLKNLHETSFELMNTMSVEKAEEIRKTRMFRAKLEFSCLLCNDERVPFDDSSKTFYVPLDNQDAEWEELRFTSGQAEYKIAFLENIVKFDKQNAIAKGDKYEIIVFDDEEWSKYYVVFSGLPVIDFSTAEGFYSENITGTVVFYDTDFVTNGVVESAYNGHVRGNTSRMYPKKGYKLNLIKNTASGTTINNKQKIFGMREDDDWILYGMYNDDTKIRDMLSLEVWNSFGANPEGEKITYGFHMTYVEVFADNQYCGLYGLMEPVDAKQLNLRTSDYLYKRKNPGSLEYQKFISATDPYGEVQGFEIKHGIMNEEAWIPMAEISQIIMSEGTVFAAAIPKIIDINSAMRLWLFMQIVTGHDQTAKNVYYIARSYEDGYRFSFAPWDLDLTWGNVSVGEENPLYTAFESEIYDDWIHWETADQIIEDNIEGVTLEMQQLYQQLRGNVLSNENIEQYIQTMSDMLEDSGAYARDQKRWPGAAHTESCEQLIGYAKKRLEFLDNALLDFSLFEK